ncbi:dynein axonemal intermediate chain 7-like isoform X2 [Xenia sp. Carnegie-2017]|uniref:dynein axonemal intermediate chain 7-like isoform X2 n=1 Tax=Xenia sp. Carnegie-2017 TaxID=2897299 RepID=UPI001F03BA09|nr:dynein axonemal intermediate chain 7-like isoform X2 [Xenia sp. Carnegie-2017]
MPSKKSGKVKSPKQSKAEKEKLRKDDAELLEKEEERMLKLQQERKEKEERERLEKQEKERLAQQEREAHEVEVDELNELLREKFNEIKSAEITNKENFKWSRYMMCDGSPNPRDSKEINTYINLWRENTESKPVHKTIQDCQNAIMLINELQHYLDEEPCLAYGEIQRHKESITQLQLLIGVKLDEATMHVLKSGDDYIDVDTQNIHLEIASRFICFNIWGNISRNPRIKTVSFEKKGLLLEIPKCLSIGNIVIRCIFTNYDYFSERSRLFNPPPKIPETSVDHQHVVEVTIDESFKARSASQLSGAIFTTRSKNINSSSGKIPVPIEAVLESVKMEKTLNSDFEERNGVSVTDPNRKDDSVKEIKCDVEFDEDDDDDVVDLRAFSTSDKVIYLDLYELPPQPRLVKNWHIQRIVPSELVAVPFCYKSNKAEVTKAIENELLNANESEAQTHKNTTEIETIGVRLRLPADVSYFEQPQVARWEASKNHWRLDGLSDIHYDEQTNMLSFRVDRFAPIAIFQDVYVNMPFQSWEIRPHGLNSCIFTIVAAAIDLEIEVKEGVCCVAQAKDNIQRLRHLQGIWLTPKELIKNLKCAGVNVFPAVDAEKYVSVNVKNLVLEKNLYEQMSLTASAFSYCWSRWNTVSGTERIIVQAVEQETNKQPLDDDWSIYMAKTENCCKLKLNEYDEMFTDDVAENTKYGFPSV